MSVKRFRIQRCTIEVKYIKSWLAENLPMPNSTWKSMTQLFAPCSSCALCSDESTLNLSSCIAQVFETEITFNTSQQTKSCCGACFIGDFRKKVQCCAPTEFYYAGRMYYGPRCYVQQRMKWLFHSKLQDDLTEDDFRGKKEVSEMYDDDD